MDSATQIRSLQKELSSKNELLSQLKQRMDQLVDPDTRSKFKKDEDMVEFLTNVIRSKEEQLQTKHIELAQVQNRESEL